jgi:hypothetical protein
LACKGVGIGRQAAKPVKTSSLPFACRFHPLADGACSYKQVRRFAQPFVGELLVLDAGYIDVACGGSMRSSSGPEMRFW